jgi:hypothetical protein
MNALSFASAYRQLTDYERGFVDDFMRTLDNEAALRHERLTATLERVSRSIDVARLDERTRDMFAKPLIAAAIRERVDEIAAGRDLTPEWIVNEWRNIASGSQEHYFTVDGDGFPQIDLSDLTPAQWRNIESIDATEEYLPKGGSKRHVKLKLYDRTKALDWLGKHTGMDKTDNAVYGAYKQLPTDAAQTPTSASVADLADAYARFIDG